MSNFFESLLGAKVEVVTEAWVPIPGFESYMISDQGGVKTLHRDRLLLLDWSGRIGYQYRSVRLYDGKGNRKKLILHKLVYSSFKGEVPEGHQVDHIDRDRMNNALSNLRCVSIVENLQNRGGMFEEAEVVKEENFWESGG